MSKLTKNERIDRLERQVTALTTLLKMKGYKEPEPKLKVLDQSVFDGADPKYITAATNEDGRTFLFPVPKSELEHALGCWFSDYRGDSPHVDGLFDATDWQNSLIERDIEALMPFIEPVEITDGDLCRAMLNRGDKNIPCLTGLNKDDMAIISRCNESCFYTYGGQSILFVTPVNLETGEPLTASEVGL